LNHLKDTFLKILILNGPNLNLLGKREPTIYGDQNFNVYLTNLQAKFSDHTIDYVQSNIEGDLINTLHQADEKYTGIILNAGGYAHTSVALADAVAAIKTPVISVHISNIYQRESERHQELLSQYVVGGIFGLGLQSYQLAIQHLLTL
jgi:3-dehydroquinate dehydratase II